MLCRGETVRRYLRRGISPIIATVLLILIAIATGLLIYTFATGWIGGRASTGTGPTSSITIEAANISSKGVTVYVRNIGGVPTNISAVYVTDLSSGSVYADTSPTVDNPINPGEVKKVYADLSGFTPSKGYSYEIKVVTSDGASATLTITYR